MEDHLVLYVDRLIVPQPVETVEGDERSAASFVKEDDVVSEENEPLIQLMECRICQEEDQVKNLETPCSCSGSLKHAHRECVQRWCNEKGDIICEICHEPYMPGYIAPPHLPPDETTIDISGAWTITGASIDSGDPRILAMVAAQHHFLEAEYDDAAATNASGATFCRSAALILMALLLLRHALSMTTEGDDDAFSYFSIFLMRAAGFLLPVYIMAWAISILNRRRKRQPWPSFCSLVKEGACSLALYLNLLQLLSKSHINEHCRSSCIAALKCLARVPLRQKLNIGGF